MKLIGEASDYSEFEKIAEMAKIQLNIKTTSCPQPILDSLFLGLKRGISCLQEMGTPQTQRYIKKIDSLLLSESQTIQLNCLPTLPDNAYAISSYPFNPNFPKIDYNMTSPSSDLVALGFHEFLHMLGSPFYHGFEPDRTNACETCCFGSKTPESCKICSGLTESESKLNCSALVKKYPKFDENTYFSSEHNFLVKYPKLLELAGKSKMTYYDIYKCYL